MLRTYSFWNCVICYLAIKIHTFFCVSFFYLRDRNEDKLEKTLSLNNFYVPVELRKYFNNGMKMTDLTSDEEFQLGKYMYV